MQGADDRYLHGHQHSRSTFCRDHGTWSSRQRLISNKISRGFKLPSAQRVLKVSAPDWGLSHLFSSCRSDGMKWFLAGPFLFFKKETVVVSARWNVIPSPSDNTSRLAAGDYDIRISCLSHHHLVERASQAAGQPFGPVSAALIRFLFG